MNSIKRILMPLGVAGQAEQRLTGAFAVARHYQAHLDVMFTYVSPKQTIPQSIFGMSRQAMENLAEMADQHAGTLANEIKETFNRLCEEHSVSTLDKPSADLKVTAQWHHVDGLRSQICAQYGRVSDLIVVAVPAVPGPSRLIEAVTTETGRPVLVMPRAQQTFSPAHVAIGWNGSAQASSAVRASLQTLCNADKVSLLTTADRMDNTPDARDLSDYLAWHGITPELHVIDVQSRSVGEALFTEAAAIQADLLVLGAYSNRQVREMFIGSVTQYVLSSATLPVMMAH